MVAWLARRTSDREVRVRDLTVVVVLSSWERQLTLTALLSTQEYKIKDGSEFPITNAGWGSPR